MEREGVPGSWSEVLSQCCNLDNVLTAAQDERRMARFAQYAMVASEEALKDAEWAPTKEEDLEASV